MRSWPLIVNVRKGRTRKNPDPVHVLHISRDNGDSIGYVRTECGRELTYSTIQAFPAENFRKAGDDLMVEPDYNFMGKFKMCKRCGSPEDFAKAMEDYVIGRDRATKEAFAVADAKMESVAKMKCAIRATIIATALPEGAENVENNEWGVTFTLNGVPYELRPTEDECERLYKAAEEAACHSE